MNGPRHSAAPANHHGGHARRQPEIRRFSQCLAMATVVATLCCLARPTSAEPAVSYPEPSTRPMALPPPSIEEGNDSRLTIAPLTSDPARHSAPPLSVAGPSDAVAPHAEQIPAPEAYPTTLNKRIGEVTTKTRPPAGELPEMLAGGGTAQGLEPDGVRDWRQLAYHWHAPAVCHQPLYFEDVNLERYGYSPRHLRPIQPLVSGARFYMTLPALPYLVAANPPNEGIYTLGEYRPGSCVPYRTQLVPWDPKAAGIEAGWIAGALLLVP